MASYIMRFRAAKLVARCWRKECFYAGAELQKLAFMEFSRAKFLCDKNVLLAES